MRIGINLMLSDRTVPISFAAPAVEERGLESLWVGEHTHLPVDTVHHYTRGRYGSGVEEREGHVPDYYRRFVDPYVTLCVAAALTSRLRIGTCVALPAEHNPLILAKVIATLDHVSEGRFEFGVGFGWNPLEMRNNGIDPEFRRDVMREKIRAMRDLWTLESTAADGQYVRFTESWSFPKPAQQPHPPVLLGAAATEANLSDMAEWADGWMPVRSFITGDLAESVARVRSHLAAQGRDVFRFPITIIDPRGGWGGKRSTEAFRDLLPSDAELDEYASLGIHRVCLGVPVADRDHFCWALDEIQARARTVAA